MAEDKIKARWRVNNAIRAGRLAHPNTLPCKDCGHVHAPGEKRHEYDHHLGYDAAHQLDVEAVCSTCHHKRDNKKAAQTHCVHGHRFTLENTLLASNGTRHCRACMKDREKNRGPRGSEYWKRVNAKRRGEHHGR